MKFYEATVAVEVGTLKNGNPKKKTESYLVNAVSVTDAEAKVAKYFEDSSGGVLVNYNVSSVKQSKVIDFIK